MSGDPGSPGFADTEPREVDLAITGMTCASCSARIERKLTRLGTDTNVNLVTEKAHVVFREPLTVDDLIGTVRGMGYGATEIVPASARARAKATDRAGAGADGPSTGESADADAVAHPASEPGVADDAKRPIDPRARLAIAAVLTIPVLFLAMSPGFDVPWNPWAQLVLATPVALWCAWPFHRAAALNARHGSSTMDTLVSIGVIASWAWSVVILLGWATGWWGTHADGGHALPHLWFETAAVVTTFLLLGRYLEERAKNAGKSALTSLASLSVRDVAVERIDARTRATAAVRIPIEDLAVGDTFIVRPGERVATDGIVREGTSAVDASLVTGESVPVDVVAGDEVVGGSLNVNGRLTVEARAVGADTTLASITRLVEQAQNGSSPAQRLADRVSAVFVPVVLGLALLTLAGWWIGTGSFATALSAAVAVLVIACPCALGLATPTALVAGTGRGAERGILIKGPQVLEDTRAVDTVVLDKTGTVTTGHGRLVDVTAAGRLDPDAALRAAAAVESGSEHPIARAVVAGATERGLSIPAATGVEALPGSGARGTVNGTEVVVGKPELFTEVPQELREPADDAEQAEDAVQASPPDGAAGTPDRVADASRLVADASDRVAGTRVLVGWGGVAQAALTVADDVRPEAGEAIAALRARGIDVRLLTGDSERVARAVAAQVGIDTGDGGSVVAQVRPEDKHAAIEAMQREGRVVAMVGDGINDAPALVQADVGIAMGGGTDQASASADVVLVRDDLRAVEEALDLSTRTVQVIRQNLVWAFGYNVIAIPIAMSGRLDPMIAGAAMALSSVTVVGNSLRLRAFRRSSR